jgi:rhamnosyltransferase
MPVGSTLRGDDRTPENEMTAASPFLSLGVAVITHRAVSQLSHCLPPLLDSGAAPRVLVVNSSSGDGTVELAQKMGAEVLVVPRNEFNHGVTREIARHVLGTDIVVMMTPDARPQNPDLLANLIRPILQGAASVAYARQIPHEGAKFFEAFPRSFNYPESSETRSIEDMKRIGPGTFFCSNVCAAWLNSALDEIGGFSPTLSLEDVIATARLLHAGHRIAYCADAVVAHSHRYSLAQEFRRHFDTGYVRAQQRRLLFTAGGDERRGAAYGTVMMRRLLREKSWLAPYGLAHLVTKYAGYRVGFHGHGLPHWVKRSLSGQDYYWQGWASQPDPGVMQSQPRAIT